MFATKMLQIKQTELWNDEGIKSNKTKVHIEEPEITDWIYAIQSPKSAFK